tara:strand:- start:224 stop:700 length:477 start_codon:yes stop_codon:yes gene_type:complete
MGKGAGFIHWLWLHWELPAAGCLILCYLIYGQYQQSVVSEIVAKPRQSDFLFVDYHALNSSSDAKYRFVPLKVIRADAQNITVAVGNIGYSEPVSPEKHVQFDRPLLLRNYYRQSRLQLSRTELISMYRSGIIYDARGPRNIYISGWSVIRLSEVYTE